MNRNERARIAQETLDIFKKGYYMKAKEKIACHSKFTAEFITERQLETVSVPESVFSSQYEVVNESVVDTVIRYGGDKCGVLNFASAKNPGGGFLNGSLAQEEALAVSSDLYNSQLQAREFYDANRSCRTALYTHNMIYSHGISFIRDGRMNLLHSPVYANVLTSPAVNAGAFYQNENRNKSTVIAAMEKRIRYILKIFGIKYNRTVILGAFGCGVFKNEPDDVAGIFHKLLKDEQMEKHFERIVFAVYDPKGHVYDVFYRRFGDGSHNGQHQHN